MTTDTSPGQIQAFTFGDPTPVLDRTDIMDYAQSLSNGQWYEPPISWTGLAKTFRAGTHHASALYFKRNILESTFIPNKLLSREAFSRFALDFLIFGNGYIERQNNRLGQVLKLAPTLAKNTRRAADLVNYVQINGWQETHKFAPGSIFHLQEADINQEIYGLPQYLAALNSVWLNESATLFRRKYYQNGSHAGFILYMTDPAQNEADIDTMRQALKDSKGPGNFRNLFMYAPAGKKDGIQLIPISEIAAKDEFFNIKNVSRDDQLAAHRVPPQLIGVVPNNTGGFGAPDVSAKVFAKNEIEPLQNRFRELNNWIGEEVVKFNPYTLDTTTA